MGDAVGLLEIKKRDGSVVKFDRSKIKSAITKAFISNDISNDFLMEKLTAEVVAILERKFPATSVPSVEDTQDIVENVLVKNNYYKIAKHYILYRQKHAEIRQERLMGEIKAQKLKVKQKDGTLVAFDPSRISNELEKIGADLKRISVEELVEEISKTVYDGISVQEVHDSILNAAKAKIDEHYDYSYLASRLVLNKLYKDILGVPIYSDKLSQLYAEKFVAYVDKGVELGMLSPELKNFDLGKIAKALVADRDNMFQYLGMQTIYDRYLLRTRKTPKMAYELPQWLWVRVSMGLALKEQQREEKAIEFYDALSQFYVLSSTPTLFNGGTTHSQMSSCYINTVADSIEGIFKTYKDCAHLSKWAGGIGTDWTQVRAKGAKIVGTNGSSQGIIPFVKIYNDTALAVNQGGKRKGAFAAYLEVWHRDIEEFMELRKNTGDERRRAHDIHTAVFIPDLFMKRVRERGEWTLFSPDTVNLWNCYGKTFETRYLEYEAQNIYGSKKVSAFDLWKRLLSMLYETGHPWITFKDTINIRSPQDHVGIVHSSNLCTEITLNTSAEETAVCNLASVNLAKMVKDKKLHEELLAKSVRTAMRMLDNVIDNNYYPTAEAEFSNLKHRPVGLGVMGYQDALYQLEVDFESEESLEFADHSQEMISYYAILASSEIAKERGTYPSYPGSKWDRGIFPFDTLELVDKDRGESLTVPRDMRLDWIKVREHVKQYGMRNSNCQAIAPTATIANIAGCTPCIEPTYKNIYMKENLSGNFLVVNTFLIDALDDIGLWNQDMLRKVKLNNGSVLSIDEIPAAIRRRFKEVFEIEPQWIIKAAALRAKWIDQSASTNIFLKSRSGKMMSDLYTLAWEQGLKTTYYLRTLAASQITKTVEDDAIPNGASNGVATGDIDNSTKELQVCKLDDPDCEACQ